jgi:hypothetical protein
MSSDEPVVPRVFDHHEQPPLSSYSELSAHLKHYTIFTSTSQLAKATTGQSQPHPVTTASAWKGSHHASSTSQDMDMLPPLPAPQAPPPPPSHVFEPPPSSQCKYKGMGGRLTSLPVSKQFGSPERSARSSSSKSRRSRTLLPSSRSQGVLKTIVMNRRGSELKKQNLACLFCRERKIACGRPAEGSLDPTCK